MAGHKHRRSFNNVTPKGIPMATIGRLNNEYAVPTYELADVLARDIASLDREYDKLNGDPDPVGGGVNVLAERAASYLPNGPSAEALLRRIWDIRNGRRRTTGAEIADALLLAGNRHIETEEITTLPGGKAAAEEMVEIHCENTGEQLTLPEKRQLAKQLFDFSRGYAAGLEGLPDDAEAWQRDVDNYKNRLPCHVEEAA